jgi:hypothetical protein
MALSAFAGGADECMVGMNLETLVGVSMVARASEADVFENRVVRQIHNSTKCLYQPLRGILCTDQVCVRQVDFHHDH